MATPIRWMPVIRQGTAQEVEQLLATHPDLPTAQGPDILAYAARRNRADLLPYLVAAGIDVNIGTTSETPLGAAAATAAFEAAAWLLDHGADVNGRASPGQVTPLHQAIREGRLEMVKFLLDRGADPNLTNGNPARNALAAARFWGKKEVAGFLEGQGPPEVVIEPELIDVEAAEFQAKSTPNPTEWFEQKWLPVYRFVTRRGLESVGERNRVLFLVGYLIDQLCNGGAFMVYRNPSAVYAPAMPPALARIGAERAGELIREINTLFPGGAPAVDWHTREQQMRELPRKASKLGAELDQVFDAWLPEGDGRVVVRQLYEYYHADPNDAPDRGGTEASQGSRSPRRRGR